MHRDKTGMFKRRRGHPPDIIAESRSVAGKYFLPTTRSISFVDNVSDPLIESPY
jgi:hypothetical protein